MTDQYSITNVNSRFDSGNSTASTIVADRDSESSSSRSIRTVGPSHLNQQHVDYILVAEFSIDKGSIMEHQYPNPISGDEKLGPWWEEGEEVFTG